ncbi:MAG: SGNH/GDSL hydrolase family protein [Armatimonadetes bacterium]|nr:SGNH/GDSL hydrolase family protein [Armatimonadota bacterium]
MRFRRILLPALALCGLTAAQPVAAQPVYMALGDSVAYGYTNTLNVSNGDQGYVAPFADFLGGTFYGGVRPKVDNLAISGETAAAFAGLAPNNAAGVAANTNYSTPLVGPNGTMTPESAAFFQAVSYEEAQGNTIADVSLSIGADDAFAAFANNPALTKSDIDALINGIGTEETSFLSSLRAVLPNTQVLLLNYYDPFPTYATPTTPDQALSNALSGLASYANMDYTNVQEGLAATYGARFVDISGMPPSDTFILDPSTPFPTGVHPNAAGYQYIARQMDQTVTVPESGAWALLALGLPLIGMMAWKRKA